MWRVILASGAAVSCVAMQMRDSVEGTACKQDDDCPFDGKSYMRCCPTSKEAPGCPDSGSVAKQRTPTATCTLPGYFGQAECTCTKPPVCVDENEFHYGWPYKAPRSGKKQWLIIGDSISFQAWNGILKIPNATSVLDYDIMHIPDNGKNVWWGAHCLDVWLGEDSSRWDLVSFNFGLHDLALTNERVEPETYAKLLSSIAQRIADAAPQATLLYADTTPVPLGSRKPCVVSGKHEEGGCPPRDPKDVKVYNEAAQSALKMLPMKIHRIEMYKTVTEKCGEWYEECENFQLSRSVHYDTDGILALGASYLSAADAALASK